MKILENPETCKPTGKNILSAVFHVIRFLCIGWNLQKSKHLKKFE